jgi:hypothetical protein
MKICFICTEIFAWITFYGVSAASIDDAVSYLSYPVNFLFLKKKPTGIIIKIPLARGL